MKLKIYEQYCFWQNDKKTLFFCMYVDGCTFSVQLHIIPYYAVPSSETQGFKGDGKGRERLGAGKKKERGGEGRGKGTHFPLSLPLPSPSLSFFAAPSLSLPFPSPLKPWVSEDDAVLSWCRCCRYTFFSLLV